MIRCDRSRDAKYSVIVTILLFLASVYAGLCGEKFICMLGLLSFAIIVFGFYNSVYSVMFTESGISYDTYFKPTKEYLHFSYDEIELFWKNRKHTVLGIRIKDDSKWDYISKSGEVMFNDVIEFLNEHNIEIADK